MKIRVIIAFLLVFFALGFASAQDSVDNSELEDHLAPVEFVNNENRPARIDTRLQIWGIGNELGLVVKNGSTNTGQAARYFVIHCAGDESEKLGGDIFGLGVGVGVDHIRNLRTILQGYLEGAYDYSPQDAALLAQYITVYNAVFRGNMDYMLARYNNAVVDNLVPENIGLDPHYTQWAGKTLMVIPLGNAHAGSLSAINTSPLTEPQVIDEMRKEDDKGIPERKDMVDLKEREVEEAEKKAAEQSLAVEKEQAAIDEERKQLAEEKADAGEDKQEELDQKEKDLDRREAEATAQKEEAEENQEFAEKKTAEAQQERKDIAEDQQQMITDEPTNQPKPKPSFVFGMILNDSSSPLGNIVRIDTGTDGKADQVSVLTAVNVRTINIIDDFIYTLVPQSDGSYRLVKIAVDSLEITAQGSDPISENSLLWVKGSDIYALVSTDSASLRLALFDKNLQLQAQSAIAVHPFASVLFNKNVVVTQRNDGSALFLDPRDLTEVDPMDVN
jgi:hypothetical protein